MTWVSFIELRKTVWRLNFEHFNKRVPSVFVCFDETIEGFSSAYLILIVVYYLIHISKTKDPGEVQAAGKHLKHMSRVYKSCCNMASFSRLVHLIVVSDAENKNNTNQSSGC